MDLQGRAILLTPPGGAAIAVVRLAGPGAAGFLSRHFSRPAAPGRCVHGTLSDGPRVIDDPVVVLHAGGAVADVNLHGGPWVVRSVLELARREGFETIESPGLPLPDEAVDAETQLGRDVLRYLPMARTELAVRVLLAQEEAWARLKQEANFTPSPGTPGEASGIGGRPRAGGGGVFFAGNAKEGPHPNPPPEYRERE